MFFSKYKENVTKIKLKMLLGMMEIQIKKKQFVR